MNSNQYRMCGKKRRYSLRAAHRAAGRINEKQDSQVHVYHCPLCRNYHVGHDTKNKKSDSVSYAR